VEPKIPKIKKEVFDDVPAELTLPPEKIRFYKERLEDALRGLFHPPEEGIADSIFIVPERNEMSTRIRAQLLEKPATIANLTLMASELDKKTAELRETDQRLKQFNQDPSAVERGNALREKRGALNSQKENLQYEIQDLEEKKQSLKTELQENNRRATNLTEEVTKLHRGRTLNNLAYQYREAVAEIKSRAAIKLRDKIAHIVGDLWLDITDRGLEYRALTFDKNWNCDLTKSNGQKIAWDSANTSAGQRQVRILAFTEALRRLAKFVPPLVVDTPLGRLDKEVKEGVLGRLYLSGHQSIILTTNSEISPNEQLFEEIAPKLARVYTLNPEGDQDSQTYHVQVSNDYFKHVL
jgi:DNA sulfur modification protein DndD